MNLFAEFIRQIPKLQINPMYAADPGATRIQSLQSILINGPVCIDGTFIGTPGARLILATYHKLSRGQQERFRNVPAGRMLLIAHQSIRAFAGLENSVALI